MESTTNHFRHQFRRKTTIRGTKTYCRGIPFLKERIESAQFVFFLSNTLPVPSSHAIGFCPVDPYLAINAFCFVARDFDNGEVICAVKPHATEYRPAPAIGGAEGTGGDVAVGGGDGVATTTEEALLAVLVVGVDGGGGVGGEFDAGGGDTIAGVGGGDTGVDVAGGVGSVSLVVAVVTAKSRKDGTSSRSSTVTMIGSPTVYSFPGEARSFATNPSSCASKSMVALSVSILAMASPALNESPSATYHSARLPVLMVGERAGRPTTRWYGRVDDQQSCV